MKIVAEGGLMRWFRVALDERTGKVISCSEVGGSTLKSDVYYVQALNAADAERAARKLSCAQNTRLRRERLIAEGKCYVCARPANQGTGKRCSDCVERERLYDKRARDKAAGRPVPALDRLEALAKHKALEHAVVVESAAPSLRLSVLLEVQAAWENSATNSVFTRWLGQQVTAAKAGKAA